MDSIWMADTVLPQFQTLKEDAKTDVLIIGGGMAGILCAWFLEKRGIDYMLVEGRTICSGITKNTTAKITSLHGPMYHRLQSELGDERTRMYFEANQNAVKEYARLCADIACEYEERTAYVYSLDDRQLLEDEADALRRVGADVTLSEVSELPFPVVGTVGAAHQAQFHPLRFLSRIVQGLKIYEHTFVKGFKEHTAVTDNGRITFDQVIFATHFPIDNKHGMYFLKMYQDRSYVIALKNVTQIAGMYIDGKKGGMSFRCYKDHLLLGGGAHRTGKKGGCWQELREFAKKYYPSSQETYYWATQDCMTLDGIPYIGPYSGNMPGCFVATGFNKWGMTSSMAAACILADLVEGRENPYAKVFCPSRTMWKPKLFINGWEAVTNLLTISDKRCPHLGCALKWNGAEHTWDCPCHGSRFDEKGELLDNPANGGLKL